MDQDTKPRGRAVTERVTIQTLTLHDGSKRTVSSRPVADGQNYYEWLELVAAENRTRWLSIKDGYFFHFAFGGSEDSPVRITKHDRKKLRNGVKAARTYAIHNGKPSVIVKGDRKGGITHFKIVDRENPKEVALAIRQAIKDRRMQNAFGDRVNGQCDQLGTGVDQIDEIIAEQNNRTAQNSL